MSTERVVILGGARTPIGSFGGVFRETPGYVLGARASEEALRRSGVDKADVDEVIMGCIGQVGPDAYNARRVALEAGLDINTPAFTVNRLCGSGLQSIWSGAQELLWGGTDVVLAGGNESMTRMPFYDYNARWRVIRGHVSQPKNRWRHEVEHRRGGLTRANVRGVYRLPLRARTDRVGAARK